MKYYIRKDKNSDVQGPLTTNQLVTQIETGSIPRDFLASSDLGETIAQLRRYRGCDWFPLARIPELRQLFPVVPPGRFRDYEEVPWHRRSGINSLFVVINVLTLGWVPLTLVACINLLTGHVYYNKKDEDGYLRTWSPINEVAALIILLVNAGYLLFILFRR